MPPSPLTATVRYTPPGNRKYYFLTTAATYTAPTRGELNAGTDLTAEVAVVTGWQLTGATIQAPDLATGFVAEVSARVTTSGNEIDFWASSTSADVRTVLTRGTTGYIVILPEGDITGQKMEVWPVKVTSMFLDSNMENPAQVHVQFSVTKIPAQNVAIP